MEFKTLHLISNLSINQLTSNGYTVSINYTESENIHNSHMCIGTISKNNNSILFTEIDDNEDSILEVCANHGHNPIELLKELYNDFGIYFTDDEKFYKDIKDNNIPMNSVDILCKKSVEEYLGIKGDKSNNTVFKDVLRTINDLFGYEVCIKEAQFETIHGYEYKVVNEAKEFYASGFTNTLNCAATRAIDVALYDIAKVNG